MIRKRAVLPAAVTVLAALFAIVGCGRPATAPSAQSPVAAVTTVPSLPIQRFMFTFPEIAQADHARFVLASRCMKTFGIDFTPPPIDEAEIGMQVELQSRRYGITDAAVAATRGFQPPVEATTRSIQALTAGMDAAEIEVFDGPRPGQPPARYHGKPIPPTGCDGAAIQAIAPHGNFAHSRLTAGISAESFQQSQKDPAVIAVFQRWSACMRQAGYDYPTPLASAEDARWTGPVTPVQIAAAHADLTCKTRTDLVQVWYGVESRLQNAAIATNQAELNRLGSDRDAQLTAARSILSGH